MKLVLHPHHSLLISTCLEVDGKCWASGSLLYSILSKRSVCVKSLNALCQTDSSTIHKHTMTLITVKSDIQYCSACWKPYRSWETKDKHCRSCWLMHSRGLKVGKHWTDVSEYTPKSKDHIMCHSCRISMWLWSCKIGSIL